MLSMYIVNILGGMFFGWIFLFTGLNNLGYMKPRLPYSILELAAFQDELSSTGKYRAYKELKNKNHTHFVFTKEIPGDMAGKDGRRADMEDERELAEQQKIRDLFHKLAILDQLSTPGNPASKMELIRREHLTLYGDTEIRAPRVAIRSDAWDDDSF